MTYTIVDIPGRDDAKLFNIDPSTGQLRTRAGLDAEAEDYDPEAGYMVRVTVSDKKNDAGITDSAIDDTSDVTITVTSVNEPPMFRSSTASLSVYEETTQVNDPDEELIATDPDEDDTLAYSLSGPDAGTFAISNVGVLSLPTQLAYATDKRTYRVTVIVRDSDFSDIIDVTIQLLEVTAGNTTLAFVDGNDSAP